MIKNAVKKITGKYKRDVLIILRCNSGFFDEDNFRAFEEMKTGCTGGNKFYDDIKDYIDSKPSKS